jgi:hypothetical protein
MLLTRQKVYRLKMMDVDEGGLFSVSIGIETIIERVMT